MKWFHVIRNSNAHPHPMVVDTANLGGLDEWYMQDGKRVESWKEDTWLKVSKKANNGIPDDALQNHLGIPVFSERLIKALQKAGLEGIQYLPIEVRTFDGRVLGGFQIANILNKRMALDLRQSDYDIYPEDYFLEDRRGKLRGLMIPVLIGSAINDVNIFRLAEYPVSWYVSERFVEVFDSNNFSGLSFSECEVI